MVFSIVNPQTVYDIFLTGAELFLAGLVLLRLSSSLQAPQTSFPPLFTLKHSLGKSFTLSLGLTDFGSLELALLLPIGGLQSTFLFLVSSEA